MDQSEANLTRSRATQAMVDQHLQELEMQAALFDRPPLNLARHIEQTRRHAREAAAQVKALERAGDPPSAIARLCQRLGERLRDLGQRVADLERSAASAAPEVPASLSGQIAAIRAEIAGIKRQIDQLGDHDAAPGEVA